jgi:hypothetical protein
VTNNGTALTGSIKIVEGTSGTIDDGANGTVTLSPAFTSTSSYTCTVSGSGSAGAFGSVTNTSASEITIHNSGFNSGYDSPFTYICIGD